MKEGLFHVVEADVSTKKIGDDARKKYSFKEKKEAISIAQSSVLCYATLTKVGTINLLSPTSQTLKTLNLI